ncbi:MAG TPA: S8 family peptidase [Chloroflexota bacterium]|nr:S8 family peptidase [Chloroflexota bacterium]
MLHFHAPKQLISLLAVAIVALPVFAVPASAAPAPARLDDEVSQRLQTATASQRIPVIVEGSPEGDGAGRALRAESRVLSGGGVVVGSSSLLGASVAELTPSQIRTLADDPSVGRIHIDAEVKATAINDADTSVGGQTPIVFQQAIGATQAWEDGFTGKGVTVAVLDTGIDDNNPAFGSRVKARVDLIDPTHPALGDPAGHGTHLAGIIAAGRDAPSPGIAPDAELVSVRVLDQNGSSRLSTVIHGLEWAIAHKSSLGIRVVVMALGAPAQGGYRHDPLAAAAEIAWRSGLVLVTAAGNDGPGAGTIETPGIDPLVLTVGASDDNGTVALADDSIPFWSSVGPTPDGLAKPELVAPGRKIVSVRVPGSTLDVQSPTHIEGPTTIRFSGTSESTAVAGGAAALLLQQRPELSPDETKALLVGGARPLAGSSAAVQGAGLINVERALNARTPQVVRPHLLPAEGLILALLPLFGDLQGDGPADGHQFGDGNQGINADHVRWDHVRWDEVRWDDVRWDHVRWDEVRWDHVRWDHVRWDHVRWDHVRWDQVRWDGTVYD